MVTHQGSQQATSASLLATFTKARRNADARCVLCRVCVLCVKPNVFYSSVHFLCFSAKNKYLILPSSWAIAVCTDLYTCHGVFVLPVLVLFVYVLLHFRAARDHEGAAKDKAFLEEITVVVLEELGVTDSSPHNPTKVRAWLVTLLALPPWPVYLLPLIVMQNLSYLRIQRSMCMFVKVYWIGSSGRI